MDTRRARRVRVEAVGEVAVAALRRGADPGVAVPGEEPRHQAEVRLPGSLESRVALEETADVLRLGRREPDDAPPLLLRERQRLAEQRDPLWIELGPVGVIAVPPREKVAGVRRLRECGVRV